MLFPEDLLDKAATVLVRANTETHLTALQVGNGLEVLPGLAARTANSRTVETQKSMYIPYPLLPYVLEQRLTAKEAMARLVPAIQTHGLESVCTPLDFLVATTTCTAAQGPPVTIQNTVGSIPLGLASVRSQRQQDVLYSFFPALAPQARSKPQALQQIV